MARIAEEAGAKPRVMNELSRRSPEETRKTLQVIVAAMAGGVVFFQLVALIVPVVKSQGEPILSFNAPVFAVVAVAASFVIPKVVLRSMRSTMAADSGTSAYGETASNTEESQLVGGLATATILGCAALEGAALLAVVAYMMERNPLMIAIVAVLVVLLLMRVPTRLGVERWLARQRRLIADLRAGQ